MLNLQQISKTDSILLPTIYKSIEDNRVFKKAEFKESFIKNINQLLSLRESRATALSTLNIFCDHHSVVSSSLVTEKTCPEISWIEQLLRFIEQEQLHHGECFEILSKLLRITACNPDTNKLVQSKYVQKIIEAVIRSTATPQQALSCLATCFELHGGTSGIYKNKIYDYCVSFIDLPDEEIAERASLCLHLLQQSRGGSVAGGVYKKCWAEFHEKTIGSLEEVLEQIVKKSNSKLGKSEQLQLPELNLSPEPFNMYTQLLVRFQNLITILRVSLERPFATAKTVQVSRVLTLIEDGIATSQVLLSKRAVSEGMILSLIHGQIHTNLLEILKTLMRSLKQNVIVHSKTICDVLWRCLKQTNSHEQLKFEANLKLRAATYEAFMVFMEITPNNFYMKSVMENLMKEALIDVTPANNEIYLMVPHQNGGGKANKRKKLNADKKFAKGRSHIVSVSDEQKVCVRALEFLSKLLVYQGVLMKPVLFYIMQEKIVAICSAIASKIQQDGDLYRDPNCRSKLLNVVGSMMTHPVHKMPVPINFGVAFLTKLKNSDPDSNVRESASINLSRAETTIHNRKDVFYFPPEYSELRETLMFNKQTIHKFNEATNPQTATERTESSEDTGKEMDTVEIIEESEDIVISDNETEDSDIQVVKSAETEKADASIAEPTEINEISDDDEETEPKKEEIIEVQETVKSPTKAAAAEKRSTRSSPRAAPAKKQKVTNEADDALLEEYLADFKE